MKRGVTTCLLLGCIDLCVGHVMRRGGLKGGRNRVGLTKADDGPQQAGAPGTLYVSAALGIGKRGIDLERCYQGEFDANGKRSGFGTYRYANGFMTYEGNFVNGMKHGKGRMKFKDGGYYDGDFQLDEMTGQAIRRFSNGSTYIGTFLKGDMHGSGMLTHRNQDTFEGQMDHNRMHGQGTFRYANGDVYRGDFVANRITGQGTMVYVNGEKYDGAWLDGKRCGQGRCTYANGNNYRGLWADDMFNGQGMLLLAAQGIRYRGLFVNGRPAEVPTKLNVFWYESGEESTARPAPTKSKASTVEDVAPLLQNTLGTPLASPLTIAAQFTPCPAPPADDTTIITQPAFGGAAAVAAKTSAVKGAAVPAAAGPRPVMSEPNGQVWCTSTMEFGRIANLTLHAAPPVPVTVERPLGVTLCLTLLPDGSVALRVLLLPVLLDAPLPLQRLEDGTPVYCLEVFLDKGSHTFDNLAVGDPRDFETLQNAAGVGYLVASCQWGLAPGWCRIALPDTKAKDPLGPSPPAKK
ncbi:hypothetical protein V8C86DRAFT_1220949 [Haematococcus lacustris]